MEEALKVRKGARHAFFRTRKEMSLAEDGEAFEMSLRDLALENGRSRLGKFFRRQRRFLDAIISVIQIAIDGHQIPDAVLICEKRDWDPIQWDITVEIDQLFHSVVSNPTAKLRSFVDKNVNTALGKFAKNLLQRLVQPALEVLVNIGNNLLVAYINQDNLSKQKKRLQVSILRILMYLSDCYRYTFDPKKAQRVADLMRFSDSSDAEAYMRIAMNAAISTDCAKDLTPFFHYCIFLNNRNVDLKSIEAKLVHRYVKNSRDIMLKKNMDSCPTRERAVLMFVDTIWALLTSDLKQTSCKDRDEKLWKTLVEFLKEASEKDVLCMVGAVLFSHNRHAEKGDYNTDHLQWQVADSFLYKFMCVLAEDVVCGLKQVRTLIRNRKKNRRRAMQKKRKKDATHVTSDGTDLVAFGALRHVGPLEEVVPHLGALSFLAQYCVSRKAMVGQLRDDHDRANALQVLRVIVKELRILNEQTSTLSLNDCVEHKINKKPEGAPPLLEDVMLCNFLFCHELGMLKHVRMCSATFESIFITVPPNISEVICDDTRRTYETYVQGIATRYLTAFAMQSAQETKINVDELGIIATQSVIATAIRKQRILSLISELEKLGGGRIARMLIKVPKFLQAQDPELGREDSPSPPLPGQTPFQEGDYLHEGKQSIEIDALLIKRRKIIGSCTPGHYMRLHAEQSERDSEPAVSNSPFAYDDRHGATREDTSQKRVHVAEASQKDIIGRWNRSPRDASRLCHRIPRPKDGEELSIHDELSPAENFGATLRLQHLVYPAHTNSVSQLCCGTPGIPVWRVPHDEAAYVNITSFPASESNESRIQDQSCGEP